MVLMPCRTLLGLSLTYIIIVFGRFVFIFYVFFDPRSCVRTDYIEWCFWTNFCTC